MADEVTFEVALAEAQVTITDPGEGDTLNRIPLLYNGLLRISTTIYTVSECF